MMTNALTLYIPPEFTNILGHIGEFFKSLLYICTSYLYLYTRIVELLLQHGADVHAKDKGGLVPLHNACSYGHFEVGFKLMISIESDILPHKIFLEM